MYDVFLSHNRLQKAWVKELYRFLVSRGLCVFFDYESIAPGQNIGTAIEQALAISRHVVLILSPSSLSSRWVAMETQMSIYTDPDSTKGKLVPIIIEPVDIDKIRLSIQMLNCIDLTQVSTREDRLRFFLKHIGVQNIDDTTSEALSALLSLASKSDPGSLRIGGIQEVLSWGWDGERLLDEFIRLDYATIEGLVATHEGHSQQWAPIFMNHPDTWRMLFVEPEHIVGYWHVAPLFYDDYALAKEGMLMDSEITADRVQLFELPGWYDIYL